MSHAVLALTPHAPQRGAVAKKTPNAIDVRVGQRVRMRRLSLHLSQEKLADAIGLTFQQVQKYEKGTNRIGASRMVQIADALRTSVTALMVGAGEGEAHDPSLDPILAFAATPDGLSLLTAFNSLDRVARSAIVEIAQALARKAARS
jgi:transcriptional regulator with XRE-family HTH domain